MNPLPLRCTVIRPDGTQCNLFLGEAFDGQGDYCGCCHWHIKQSNPDYQKRCNDYWQDAALNAIIGLMMVARDKLEASRDRKDPMPEQKVLVEAVDHLYIVYQKEKILARERQHPGILAAEKLRAPFLEEAMAKARAAYLASKN